MNVVKYTNPDKVNGRKVKYTHGDCLSIKCKNGKYLGAIITGKFNRYYDVTLIQFYNKTKPLIDVFLEGNFFGTRFGTLENIEYGVDISMIACKYVDVTEEIECIGNLALIAGLHRGTYRYKDDFSELESYYLKELPVRIEKSKNAEKFPDLGFTGKHLIKVKEIVF